MYDMKKSTTELKTVTNLHRNKNRVSRRNLVLLVFLFLLHTHKPQVEYLVKKKKKKTRADDKADFFLLFCLDGRGIPMKISFFFLYLPPSFFRKSSFSSSFLGFEIFVGGILISVDLHVGHVPLFGRHGLIHLNETLGETNKGFPMRMGNGRVKNVALTCW